MKIPKKEPVLQDGVFELHQVERKSKSVLTDTRNTRITANSLNYSKDILNKQGALQNILWIGDRLLNSLLNSDPTTLEGATL